MPDGIRRNEIPPVSNGCTMQNKILDQEIIKYMHILRIQVEINAYKLSLIKLGWNDMKLQACSK
jgi:hypothetical protein